MDQAEKPCVDADSKSQDQNREGSESGLFPSIRSDRPKFWPKRYPISAPDFANPDIAEHDDRKLVVQLEPDRSHLRPLRIAGVPGHHAAI